jgi:hypothetical protein
VSKALRTVAIIAGSVALIATGVGAAAGAKGLTIAGASISAKTIATVGTVASLTAGVATLGSQLTAPKPIARGSPADVIIEVEPPRPYAVGRIMTGGVLRYDNAYGATLKRVPNPYRWQVRALSGAGPIQGIAGHFFDFAAVSSFYNGFFATSQSLGDTPQATAIAPSLSGASNPPGWTANSRMSGTAHVGLSMLFDRDGERFAAGLPVYTTLLDGVKVYDPRLDSTFPGGSGSCRPNQPATYVFSRNPALHVGTYLLGRFENGVRVFGLGQSFDTIDWTALVDWANDCDTNEWYADIMLLEGGIGSDLQSQRVRNLDDLCAAGGGRWFQAGPEVTFDWYRPRVPIATLKDEDILETGGGIDAVPTVRERMNGVRPQYISPVHNWQQITAKEIVGSTYRAEDGTALTQVWPLNGVTNAKQAGELAAYAMADSREIGPMDLQAQAKWRFYRPGDCIEIDSSLIAYQGQAVINNRSLNPQSLDVGLVLKSETPGKHAFALGKVAEPPPTPLLAQTSEERDLVAAAAIRPRDVDAEEGSTKGATIVSPAAYDPGIGVVGNVFDETGGLWKPGEVLNSEIELTPDGRLRYFELPTLPPIELGAVTLADLDGVTSAALRQAQDDIDLVSEAIATALDEASITRQTFTDAGFFVDPVSGQVKIHAVEVNSEQINAAEIRISAAEANINLRATFDYVDQAIIEAVLDPSQIADLDTVFIRLSAAEVDIDALQATVTTLATNAQVSGIEARVTTAESGINALEGTITTKVDTTTFNALDTRVTNTENTLTAIGGAAAITSIATATRLIERDQDTTAEANLLALLTSDRNNRDQIAAVADARQELKAEIVDGFAAEASARLGLQAQVENTQASIAQESVARADGDSALSTQVNQVLAVANGRNRTFRQSETPTGAVVGDLWFDTSNNNVARRWDGTQWQLTDDTRIAQNVAAITQESVARANADSALATQINALSAEVATETASLQAAITTEQQARVNADTALAGQITSLDASFTAALTTEQQARVQAIQDEANARIAAINAEAAARGTAITAEEQARIAAIQAEANARQQAVTTLTASINSEAQVRADADTALAGQISSLTATVNSNTAAITNESQVRANADTALAGQISSLTTTVNGNTSSINQFAQSINGLEARWGVSVDVNGRIGGFVLNNDAQSVSATFLADQFAVIDPSTNQPFIDADASGLRLRNGRVIMDNGVFIKAIGVGFGTNNQFIEWFGPRPAGGDIALCNEANAIAFLKTNGDAFYGGTLSAGVLKNAAQGTSIAADAFVEIGPFGSNGNPRNVVASYSFSHVGPHTDTSFSAGSDSSTANLVLERRTSGSYETVTTFNAQIDATWTQAFGPTEPGFVTVTGGASITLTDNVLITGNLEYRVRLTSRPLPNYPIPSNPISQSVGVISTEE